LNAALARQLAIFSMVGLILGLSAAQLTAGFGFPFPSSPDSHGHFGGPGFCKLHRKLSDLSLSQTGAAAKRRQAACQTKPVLCREGFDLGSSEHSHRRPVHRVAFGLAGLVGSVQCRSSGVSFNQQLRAAGLIGFGYRGAVVTMEL